MKTYQGFELAKDRIPPCVYAIGNFDGVHLGHLALLNRARELALNLDVPLGVYTFWPHPVTVLNPAIGLKLICTHEQKMQILKANGVEFLVEEPFNLEFSHKSAECFAKDVIVAALKAQAAVTGENFRFGHQALGTPQKMEEWLSPTGFKYEILPAVSVDGVVCSSSKIRVLVEAGLVADAAKLLGRPFSIIGQVVKGASRGKSLGVPTANLKSMSALMPATGVYASLVRVPGEQRVLKAATNIGTRPTFNGDQEIHIETHILDFSKMIYGETLELYFVEKIRDERKFDSIDDLLLQIQADIGVAKTVLS